jgi:hypothetical protein
MAVTKKEKRASAQAAYRAGERETTPARSVETVVSVQNTGEEQAVYRAGERNAPPPKSFEEALSVFQNLASAFIPANTIVNTSGEAVIVDINGRDINGALVEEAKPADLIKIQEGITSVDKQAATYAAAADKVIELIPTVKSVVTGGGTPSSQADFIKAGLAAIGFKKDILDSSTFFIEMLLDENIDNDKVIDILLNNKEYVTKDGIKLESPFYKQYGYLGEFSPTRKQPEEIYNMVLGVENLVKKYNISSKFASPEALKKYVTNDVEVSALDERANLARLKAISANPVYVDALVRLGYINNNQDLTDFYMDYDIGTQEFERRQRAFALTTEALKRASSGITVDAARMKQLADTLGAEGYTAETIVPLAAGAYQTISQQLPELSKLSAMYEKTDQAKNAQQLQQELESEQLLGMASQRRRKLEDRNLVEFMGSAGRASISRKTAGLI